MAKLTKVELEAALRSAAVSLVSAAIILREREAAIWTDFADDAMCAHAAGTGDAKPWSAKPWWIAEMFPRSDVAVSP